MTLLVVELTNISISTTGLKNQLADDWSGTPARGNKNICCETNPSEILGPRR